MGEDIVRAECHHARALADSHPVFYRAGSALKEKRGRGVESVGSG